MKKRMGVGSIVAITMLLLLGGCCFSPWAYLAYQRHRIDSFCGSVVKGEPIEEVSRRAQAQGLGAFEAQELEPGFGPRMIVSTNFLLARLLCSVKHDGRQVESVRRSELW